MSKIKKYMVPTLLVSASILIALLIWEALLSIFLPQYTLDRLDLDHPAMFVESEILPYEFRPGYQGRLFRDEFDTTITINALGLRSREIAPGKEDQFRILAIGDSFTFGWGVDDDETYPYVLEDILSDRLEREVEVVNAGGAGGYHPDAYYLFMRERGLALDPDLIVVGFFIGNDLSVPTSDAMVWKAVDADGLPEKIVHVSDRVYANHWMTPWGRFKYKPPLLRESHVYQLLVEKTRDLKENIDDLRAEEGVPGQYADPFSAEQSHVVDQTQKLFRAMHEMAGSRGIPLVVVMMPALEQITMPAELVALGADFDKPQKVFSAFFEAEGIPYLDLLAPARVAGPELYYPDDEHWNRAGNAFSAQRIAEFLEQKRLVPVR